MRNLTNTLTQLEAPAPARGLARQIKNTDDAIEVEFPQGTTPVRGELRVLHNEAGGVVLLATRAENPRLTGRVARLFSTGQLRLAGPAALAEFITNELSAQWAEPDPAA